VYVSVAGWPAGSSQKNISINNITIMKKQHLLLLLCSFSFVWVNAQQDTAKIKSLQEITIYGKVRLMRIDSMSNTLKLNSRLVETPQNIVSISNNLLQAQGAFEMKDALRNASGMYTGSSPSVFGAANTITARGLTPVAVFRNGLSGGNTYQNTQEDEALIERMEIIKGPAGFLNSAGEAAGSINVVTKTPRRVLTAAVTAGSFDFYRVSLDAGTAQREKGFSYRINTAFQSQGYYVDYFKKNRFVLAPVVQYNFSKRTSILAEYNLISSKAKNGTEFTKRTVLGEELKDRRSANYMADPGLPVSSLSEHTGRLVFTHQFNDRWKITSQSSYKHAPYDQWSLYAFGTFGPVYFDANGKANRQSIRYNRINDVLASQLFVNGTFKTGNHITHKLLAGIDYSYVVDSTRQVVGAKGFTFYRDEPQYGIPTDSLTATGKAYTYHNINDWIAGYVYYSVSLNNKLFLNAGLRYTNNKIARRSYTAPVDKYDYYDAYTPRFAVNYMLQQDVNVYVLYDQSFAPQGGYDVYGNRYKPQYGKNFEAGIKKDWWQGLLSTSINAYRTIKQNVFAYDVATATLTQIGEWKCQGIEVDALGMVSKNLVVSANYSLVSGKISKDTDPGKEGKRFSGGPEQQLNGWLNYTFRKGIMKGLSISAGQTAVFKNGSSSTPGTYLPDFITFDGSVGYERDKWQLRLLLDNITNKRYIANGDIKGSDIYYNEGAPFNGKIQATIRL
jgi:iron complex outermembrane receptor protein